MNLTFSDSSVNTFFNFFVKVFPDVFHPRVTPALQRHYNIRLPLPFPRIFALFLSLFFAVRRYALCIRRVLSIHASMSFGYDSSDASALFFNDPHSAYSQRKFQA